MTRLVRRVLECRNRAAATVGRRLRVAGWLLSMLLACAHGLTQAETPASPVSVVDIDGIINPGSAALLEYAIETAEANSAAALVVRLNTPGGLLSSTRDMVRSIAESAVPVIGYVGPSGASATSAGAFILLATDVAVMNSGTNLGAASPVADSGGELKGTMAKKIMNDSRAFMRSIAKRHGRNADVAERFVSDAVSLSAGEALRTGVIDRVITDFAELLQAIDGIEVRSGGKNVVLRLTGSEIRPVEPRLLDHLLRLIAHPQMTYLLIALGVLAIFIEMLAPGLTLPGILGAISLVLGLIGAQTLPINTGFLLLLMFGIGLMVAEYFVTGFGVLGIGGAVAFVLGSLNLFDGPIPADQSDVILSVSIAVSAAMLLAILLITGSVIFAARDKRLKSKIGEAMVDFDDSGYVLVDDRRFPADTLEPLRHGDRVEVVEMTDNDRLLVKKARQISPDTAGSANEEVRQTLAESAGKIRRIRQAGSRIGDDEFENRIERICKVADAILIEIEANPPDIGKARKFLGVYLDSVMQVTEGYAKTHGRIESGPLTQNFCDLLETIEDSFLEQQQKLFQDDLFDLDVKIEVLNAQLKREGIG